MKNSIKQEVNGFTKRITLNPPFDLRSTDPNKNYGIHGLDLRMELQRKNMAVQFVAYLPVYLPHVADELFFEDRKQNPFKGIGADVGYHSPFPQYEGQTKMNNCHIVEGGCYYDGSGLRADEWYEVFLREGFDAIWKLLEEEFYFRFPEEKP